VDLSAVTRIDAHGIGQLMQLLDTAHKLGGSLKVAGVPSRLREILRVTGAIKALGTTGEAGQLDSGGDPLSVPPIVKCLPQVHCSGACC
jgi:anti-anti-sigma regulatory factor